MQGKGLIKFFLGFLIIVCAYQFALILPTRGVEKRAERQATASCAGVADQLSKEACQRRGVAAYLDSMSKETVLNLGFAKFNYQELKSQQLALGLDLKGGMSVVMQVDLKDLLRVLAGDGGSNNEDFKQAIARASEMQVNSQSDYVTLFRQAFEEVAPGKKLAPLFQSNPTLRDQITFETSNAEIAALIREQANETVELTFNRLKQRIDKFGVTQPNVTLDNTTDRIIVELPGVTNPERARDFLTGQAKLEFWHIYGLDRAGLTLGQINESLRKQRAADAAPTTSVSDSTSTDSTATPTPTNTFGAGPLFEKLTLNNQGFFYRGVIGTAKASDTAAINDMLYKESLVKLPKTLKLAWGQTPTKGSTESDLIEEGLFILYGLEVPTNGKPLIEGDKITDAKEDLDPQQNAYVVSLTMNNEGARVWGKMTQEAANDSKRPITITLDDEVVSSPSVQGAITGGRTQITGNFSPQEAQDLANILQVGKLPARTQIIEENIVGPTLGAKNIRSGLISLSVGLGLVLLFMTFYYGTGGIVSIIALVANLFFIIGTLASLGTVLTLPGIAGIILTIGMAVDANVIIYERIREELRGGKSMAVAVRDGFSFSYSAIVDANVTTILVAIILYYFGLGPIKGFAAILIVGVISSLFTAVLVGRLIIDWWMGRERPISFSSNISENAFANLNIDFISKRKTTYIISGAIILAGFVSMFTKGFELGVDFKGGYSYAVQFENPTEVDAVRSAMTTAFGEEPIVKTFGSNNTIEITTSYMIRSQDEDADEQVLAKLYEGIKSVAGDASVISLERFAGTSKTEGFAPTHLTRSIKIGPTIADDIRQSAFYATLFALLLIFFYILVRFNNWQFSLGAVLALFHDVLVVLSIFSIFHGILPFSMQIDQAFIAAILTVIGYSINDTVVVFDRIREFLNAYTKKSKKEVINLAVNNTISRTIITSLTTLFVVLMLFLFGGGSIKGFAFALVVGILVGTYSSVFVATPAVYDFSGEQLTRTAGKSKTTKYGGKVIEK